ncbi:hypothetical protein L6R52_37770, partial [Myxococcota bacterium]|nr:hypothetical protein [Myxococcota bacterium]
AWLDAHVVPRVDVDLYLSTSKHRGEPAVRIDDPSRFDPRALVFFGATTPGGLVRDLRALAAGTRYDAVVVLTDGSSAELAEDGGDRRPLEAPLWLVHLGGVLPASYDDALGELVEKSGGGVDTELPRVFARIALAERTRGGLFADGYLFTVEPAGTGDPDEAGALGAIAARQRIRAALSTVDPTRLGALDHLHAMAKRHGIVTPYSSMIVLVEERQREALARAEAAADRFDREVEGGEEALTTPGLGGFGGALTATPEPEEWALFLLALAALAVAHLRKNGWLAVG